MTTISSDESIAARVMPILRHRTQPVTCVDLSRLVAIDSSAIYRCLMGRDDVVHVKSKQLTTFQVKK